MSVLLLAPFEGPKDCPSQTLKGLDGCSWFKNVRGDGGLRAGQALLSCASREQHGVWRRGLQGRGALQASAAA